MELIKLGTGETKINSTITRSLDAILPLAIVASFFKALGIALIFTVILLLVLYAKEAIRPALAPLIKFCAIFAALLIGSLLSAQPLSSFADCLKIGAASLLFIPGYYLGSLLLDKRLSTFSIVPLSLIVIGNFGFARSFGDINYFGYYTNPNITAHGLVASIMILTIILSSEDGGQTKQNDGEALRSPVTRLKVGIIIFTIACGLVLLVLTNSRQTWLALFLMSMVQTCSRPKLRGGLRIFLPLVITSLLILLLTLFDRKELSLDSNLKERIDMMSFAIRVGLNHFPIFGAGYGTFKEVSLSGTFGQVYWHHVTPHNVYIDLLFSGGIWAVAIVIISIFYLVKSIMNYLARHTPSPIFLSSLASIVGLLGMGMVDFSFANQRFLGSLFALLGILYSEMYLMRQIPVSIVNGKEYKNNPLDDLS